ncbi:hypothetical protein IX334_003024 [Bacteroides pyogenes]|nr:hypothetical protein [Bacteroides pyogenes]MBR8739973.1 hypothetical protein [Bacteroides pyogenes]
MCFSWVILGLCRKDISSESLCQYPPDAFGPKRTDLNRNEPFWTEMDCFSRRNGLLFGGMLCFFGGPVFRRVKNEAFAPM